MGFLKEFWDKKFKGKDQEDEADGSVNIQVAGRAQSEYFPSNGRQAQSSPPTKVARTPERAPAAPPLLSQTSKSFTTFQTMMRGEETRKVKEELGIASPPITKPRLEFTNFNQFVQKVEVYRGSVSTVYKAVDKDSQKKVVVKVYHKKKMQPKHIHKLDREIAIMSMINDVHSAELYGIFEDPANTYLVMEHCEGGDLFKAMLMQGGTMDEQWVCVEVIEPLLAVLEGLHGLQIMHRDIKPENIFLTRHNKFKLGDYGLAIRYDQEIPFSRSGTLDYMAPEVLRNPSTQLQEGPAVDLATLTAKGIKPYGAGVDVWAVGILAYELVCGKPPFEVEDEAQTAALIMYSNNIKFPSKHSSLWKDFVRATLVKEPEARPSAADLRRHPWIVAHMQAAAASGGAPKLTSPAPNATQSSSSSSSSSKPVLSAAPTPQPYEPATPLKAPPPPINVRPSPAGTPVPSPAPAKLSYQLPAAKPAASHVHKPAGFSDQRVSAPGGPANANAKQSLVINGMSDLRIGVQSQSEPGNDTNVDQSGAGGAAPSSVKAKAMLSSFSGGDSYADLNSPKPVAPGIKERTIFHLQRQANF